MLHIATMLGVASPFVLEHRLIIVLRSWTATVWRLVLAFGIAVALYGLMLLAITETYQPSGPMATVLYGFGLALAALLAICGGTLASPARLARITFLGTSGLAVLLPVGLYVQMAASGAWRAGYLWYLIGGVAGSVAAMKLLPWVRAVPRLSGA
jgi:hypothetical protein